MSSTKFKCEFCNNSFKSESNLKTHQTTARYCLKLQNKIGKEYACEHCKKTFTQKHVYDAHVANHKHDDKEIDIIKEKLIRQEEIIKNYQEQERKHQEQLVEQEKKYKEQLIDQERKQREQVRELQEIITKAITAPKTKITNNNNNITNNTTYVSLTEDEIARSARFDLRDVHLTNGMSGYAFLGAQMLKYSGGQITNESRRTIEYVSADGKMVKDVGCREFQKTFSKGIMPSVEKLLPVVITDIGRDETLSGDKQFEKMCKVREDAEVIKNVIETGEPSRKLASALMDKLPKKK